MPFVHKPLPWRNREPGTQCICVWTLSVVEGIQAIDTQGRPWNQNTHTLGYCIASMFLGKPEKKQWPLYQIRKELKRTTQTGKTGGQHSERTGVLSEVVSGVSFPPNPKLNTLNHRFGIEMIECYLKMIYCRRLTFLSQLWKFFLRSHSPFFRQIKFTIKLPQFCLFVFCFSFKINVKSELSGPSGFSSTSDSFCQWKPSTTLTTSSKNLHVGDLNKNLGALCLLPTSKSLRLTLYCHGQQPHPGDSNKCRKPQKTLNEFLKKPSWSFPHERLLRGA